MLPDRYQELLTAYVDGELTSRQRKAVLRLLRRSAEARDLLRQLQADSEQLRLLPRRRSDPNLALQVLQRAARQKALQPRRPVPAASTLPAWIGVAAAAAVLLAVGLGAYLCFMQYDFYGQPETALTQKNDSQPEQTNPVKPPDTPVQRDPVVQQNGTHEFVGPPRPEPDNRVVEGSHEKTPVEEPETQPTPDEQKKLFAAPYSEPEMFRLKQENVSLALVLGFRELDQAKVLDTLKKDQAFRVLLPSRETHKGFERVQNAFKSHGIHLVIEGLAQYALKYPGSRTSYVFYVEDVTPEELVKILHSIGDDDKSRKGEVPFNGGLVVGRMIEADHKELAALLGANARYLEAPKPGGSSGLDPKKPISDGTVTQVVQSMTGQGGTPRPDGKTAAKAPEHQALALPYHPLQPRSNAPEVKKYLESRKAARPGTLQVLIVLQATN